MAMMNRMKNRIPRRYAAKILIGWLILAAPAGSGWAAEPKIQRIEFVGLQRMSKEKAAEAFGLTLGSALRLEELSKGAHALLNKLAEAGHYFSRIDSIHYSVSADSSQALVRVYVFEGTPVVQGALRLQGLDSLQQNQLGSRFQSRPGRPLDPGQMQDDLDDALNQLESRGYPFCRFDLHSLNLDSLGENRQALAVSWHTALGPRLRLNEIQIVGNRVTKKNVILRELRLQPGEIYDPRKISRIRSRLIKLEYFHQVEEPQVFWTQGEEGGLLLRVVEGTASRFDGLLGYVPAAGGQKGYFTGLLDIALGNLLGTGRALEAHWQKRDQETQDIKLAYWEPWIAGWPVSAGVSFSQLIQDTIYVQREFGIHFSAPLLENLAVIGQLASVSISPDSIGSYVQGLLRSRTLTASIGVEYDSRDDRINPRHGVYYSTSVQAGRKKNLGPSEVIALQEEKDLINNKRIFLDLEWYLPTLKRQLIAWSLHGRQIKSNEGSLPLPDQFRLGGARTLRGYREDQFRGAAVAWSNLEWRYLLGRRSRVFLFADGGYFSTQSKDLKHNAFKLGYGLGFRLETGLGMMGVDYGLAQGEGLMNGKVHVGLVNEF